MRNNQFKLNISLYSWYTWKLIDCSACHSKIFHSYIIRTSVAVEGLQNWGLFSALKVFGQDWGFTCPPAVTLAHGFCGFIRGTAPLSRLARQVRGTRDTDHYYPELYFFLYCKALFRATFLQSYRYCEL